MFIKQQGEVRIDRIGAIPECQTKPVDRIPLGFIISHSESGNHHVLTGGDVMERVNDVPAGMRILYAIVKDGAEMVQDAATPHEKQTLPDGIYSFRISREYDPFAEQARMVAD